MRPTAPTGQQYEIVHGQQCAVITEVGASLRLYRVGERDVVMPYGDDEMAPAVHGVILAPWPNRIGDGRYTFGGRTHQLWLSEPERNNANHGLVQYVRWQMLMHEGDRVRLRHDLVPQPGYPFPLRLEAEYSLGGDGLALTVTATNTGGGPAPYGFGWHPWLYPGAHSLDECRLTVPGDTWVRTDERLLPVDEVTPIPPEKHFGGARPTEPPTEHPLHRGAHTNARPERAGHGQRGTSSSLAWGAGHAAPVEPADTERGTGRLVDGAMLDDAYVNIPSGRTRIELASPDGYVSAVWADDAACWQVYTGDALPGARHRGAVAAEPMTCTADAFRTGRRLVTLAPGAAHTFRCGLALTRA